MRSNRSGRSGLGGAAPFRDPFGERDDDDVGTGGGVEMMVI